MRPLTIASPWIGPGVPSSTIASLPRPSTDWCAAPARQRGSSSPPAPGACMRPPTRRSSRPPTLHGLPWLRVADASLFPDSLEINPYLTIMALADRVAEAVRRDVAALLG